MKIAIVGAGVSGLAVAARLHGHHEVTVFEAGDHAGGHAWTLDVADAPWMTAPGASAREPRDPFPVDVGFMVWNHATYPRLRALFDELGVETAPTSMGFSVSDPATGFEYAGETLDALFADRRNLVRPAFLRMVRDILHFNARAVAWVEGPYADSTLGELVERERLSGLFRDRYLVPMGAAIWSASGTDVLGFPAAFFVSFFRNHGLLEPPARQPRWRVVSGGSRRYVERLTHPFADRLRLATPVRRVRRVTDGAEVAWHDGSEHFDEVVLAVHADQALALLADASPAERRVLGSFPYRQNHCVLHTDTAMLPRRRRAWASWNHRVTGDRDTPVVVTYDLSRLQHLATPSPLLLSLNAAADVAPERVIARFELAHPVFTRESLPAQALHAEVSGRQRIHFCGAYWRNGFHEDGLVSGERVAAAILGGVPV